MIEARLQALLEHLAAGKRIPHAVAAVEGLDGTLRWAGAAGRADSVIAPDVPFHVASIDKTYTATLVMLLAEEGALDLDGFMLDYLDPARFGGIHRRSGVDHTGAITLRHLLSHTSGLADTLEDAPPGGRSLMASLLDEGDRGWTVDDLVTLLRERLTPHFPPQPLDRPRPRIRYCDTNFQLLEAVIEQVAGRPFHRLLHERLFEPLGMTHSFVLGRSQPSAATPPPAGLHLLGRPLTLPQALEAMPSLYATVGDNLRFLRALVSGSLFRRPETLAVMQSPWRRLGLSVTPAALRRPGWPIAYGLGLMRFELPRWATAFQRVPAVVGHSGATGSWLFHCPELDILTCGTVNDAAAAAVPYRFVPRLLRAVAEAR